MKCVRHDREVLSRPIRQRLRGFRSWSSDPRIKFLSAEQRMEGCRGPSTTPSHSLRSWLGYAQDDMGVESCSTDIVGFVDVSGFVIVAGV